MVSVILPFYNAEKYLSESIQSVISQTFEDWELILINDGSTDDSQEQIKQFDDKRIRYFYQENQGVASARNIGLEKMKGKFYCFLDADDQLTEKSIENRLKRFNERQNVDFIDGPVICMDEQMQQVLKIWQPKLAGSPFEDLLSLQGKSFFGPTWMIRSSYKTKFREGLTHGEDLLYFMEISRKGGKYGYVEDPIIRYRNSPESAMKNLHGLLKGYREVHTVLSHWQEVNHSELNYFRRRYQKFMLKAFLRKGDLKGILQTIL